MGANYAQPFRRMAFMLDWLLETLFPVMPGTPNSSVSRKLWVDPEFADDFGLVGVGGDLEPERLLLAYRQGVFPMYEEGEPICWWSPDPRAIFELRDLHVPRRLARTIRSKKFRVTFDRCFPGVILGCSDRPEGTWITPEVIDAYTRLHYLGYAHSVEVWYDDDLVGGVYGVAIGGFFAGESMFHRVRDASKVALFHLFEHLLRRGFDLFDTQILNDHTATLGAFNIRRREYLARLRKALKMPVSFGPPPTPNEEMFQPS